MNMVDDLKHLKLLLVGTYTNGFKVRYFCKYFVNEFCMISNEVAPQDLKSDHAEAGAIATSELVVWRPGKTVEDDSLKIGKLKILNRHTCLLTYFLDKGLSTVCGGMYMMLKEEVLFITRGCSLIHLRAPISNPSTAIWELQNFMKNMMVEIVLRAHFRAHM